MVRERSRVQISPAAPYPPLPIVFCCQPHAVRPTEIKTLSRLSPVASALTQTGAGDALSTEAGAPFRLQACPSVPGCGHQVPSQKARAAAELGLRIKPDQHFRGNIWEFGHLWASAGWPAGQARSIGHRRIGRCARFSELRMRPVVAMTCRASESIVAGRSAMSSLKAPRQNPQGRSFYTECPFLGDLVQMAQVYVLGLRRYLHGFPAW